MLSKLQNILPDRCEIDECHRWKHTFLTTNQPYCELHYKLRLAVIGHIKNGEDVDERVVYKRAEAPPVQSLINQFDEDETPIEDLLDFEGDESC